MRRQEPAEPGDRRHGPEWTIPAGWWYGVVVEGRPVREAFATRDIGALLRYLRSRGYSRVTLSAATGLSETRIRALMRGTQRVGTYDVLVRMAVGLGIPRGAMGLAYTNDWERAGGPE